VFVLDPKLAADTFLLGDTHLSQLRLMNDTRFPWVILVPRIVGAEDVSDLSPEQRVSLIEDVAAVSTALQTLHKPTKINVGALGNIVRQLHLHVLARFEGDAAWSGPVWGVGQPVPFSDESVSSTLVQLREAMKISGVDLTEPPAD